MTTSTALLLLIAAVAVVAWLALLVRTVRLDGLGQRPTSDLPRSHHADPFTPQRI